MIVKLDPSGLRQTKWHEYAVRFVAGGSATVAAAVIAQKWGPAVGGLFLAFPAIFPASATLLETHERQRKQKRGLHGRKRGVNAAAADAIGAAIGSIGLIGFAAFGWRFISHYTPSVVLAGATLVWLSISISIWFIRKRRRRTFKLRCGF